MWDNAKISISHFLRNKRCKVLATKYLHILCLFNI